MRPDESHHVEFTRLDLDPAVSVLQVASWSGWGPGQHLDEKRNLWFLGHRTINCGDPLRAPTASTDQVTPFTISSMPTNMPTTPRPDSGHCCQMARPSSTVTNPLNRGQPQDGT
jgi:hypothetical protein